jgi:hypothetical protein
LKNYNILIWNGRNKTTQKGMWRAGFQLIFNAAHRDSPWDSCPVRWGTGIIGEMPKKLLYFCGLELPRRAVTLKQSHFAPQRTSGNVWEYFWLL